MQDIVELCDAIRETAFAMHKRHQHGHLEKVFENAVVSFFASLAPFRG